MKCYLNGQKRTFSFLKFTKIMIEVGNMLNLYFVV